MRLLGISGSLRRDSHNTRLLRAAASVLPSGVELVELEPAALKAVPPFDEDDEARFVPLPVGVLREAIAEADGVLFVTPEYNGTIPGQLKNAVDWASRPSVEKSALRNKPVAVVGASTGMFGAVWAQADLRKALGLAGARVLDRELPVAGAHEAFAFDGRLAEADLETELRSILEELVATVAARAATT
jgi:chromate reductase